MCGGKLTRKSPYISPECFLCVFSLWKAEKKLHFLLVIFLSIMSVMCFFLWIGLTNLTVESLASLKSSLVYYLTNSEDILTCCGIKKRSCLSLSSPLQVYQSAMTVLPCPFYIRLLDQSNKLTFIRFTLQKWQNQVYWHQTACVLQTIRLLIFALKVVRQDQREKRRQQQQGTGTRMDKVSWVIRNQNITKTDK